jgi:uncharacterized protein YqhQ
VDPEQPGHGRPLAPADETYGGQAVIEGVMMRDRRAMCIAVRSPGGEIVRRCERLRWQGRRVLFKVPVLRGVLALADSLGLGVSALMWSAEAAGEADEKLTGWQVTLTLVLAAALAVGLFVLLPTVAVSPLRSLVEGSGAAGYGLSVALTLIEGLVRGVVLVLYVAAISRLPDVARVLAYHGAEHRVINAHEAGRDLSVQGVRGFPVVHARCGTSFLLYVVLVSIVVFSFFGWPGIWRRILIRLSLLPVVAGVSYEWIRLAGRRRSAVLAALAAPGMWLQRLTTREPDDSQVEVAIAALTGLMELSPAEEVTR